MTQRSVAERTAGNERVQRLVGAAKRIGPLAGAAHGAIRPLAIAGSVAAFVLTAVLVRPFDDASWGRWLVAIFVLAILIAPAVVLFLFDRALRDLRELPTVVRGLPEVALAQRDELGRLSAEIRATRRVRIRGVIGTIYSLSRALWPVWDLLTSVVPTARMLLPPFLLFAILSILGCLVVIAAALIAVLVTFVL
jgi:hypothetical protein